MRDYMRRWRAARASEKIYNANATPARRGKRGLTIDLEPMVHAELESIAEDEDKLLQDLLLEGVNFVLQHYKRSPIA
jgi:Antitoxin-like ribbon-helix-helix